MIYIVLSYAWSDITRVHSVHLMNVVWRQLDANLQTKPIGLGREYACRLPFATPTIAIYYYSARRPILILPSYKG